MRMNLRGPRSEGSTWGPSVLRVICVTSALSYNRGCTIAQWLRRSITLMRALYIVGAHEHPKRHGGTDFQLKFPTARSSPPKRRHRNAACQHPPESTVDVQSCTFGFARRSNAFSVLAETRGPLISTGATGPARAAASPLRMEGADASPADARPPLALSAQRKP